MKKSLILMTALFSGTVFISNLLADDEENNTVSQSLRSINGAISNVAVSAKQSINRKYANEDKKNTISNAKMLYKQKMHENNQKLKLKRKFTLISKELTENNIRDVIKSYQNCTTMIKYNKNIEEFMNKTITKLLNIEIFSGQKIGDILFHKYELTDSEKEILIEKIKYTFDNLSIQNINYDFYNGVLNMTFAEESIMSSLNIAVPSVSIRSNNLTLSINLNQKNDPQNGNIVIDFCKNSESEQWKIYQIVFSKFKSLEKFSDHAEPYYPNKY